MPLVVCGSVTCVASISRMSLRVVRESGNPNPGMKRTTASLLRLLVCLQLAGFLTQSLTFESASAGMADLLSSSVVAEWSIISTTGRGVLPSPRCGHSLNLTGAGDSASRHLVVAFGETGKTKERKFFNDVYALSNGREWELLNVLGRVPVLPRSNHSATVFGDDANSILFFGGTSLHSFLDDSLVLAGIGSDKPRWVPVYTAKNPNGRRGHSVVVKAHASNEFLLFGGQRGTLVMNDLWQFDVNTSQWLELRCSGDIPPPRAFHTAYCVQNHFCVFGGMDSTGLIKEKEIYTSSYDSREGRWHKRVIPVDPNLTGDYTGHFIGPPFYKLVLYGSKMTRDTLVVDIDPEHGTPRGPAVVLPVGNAAFQPERRNRPASAVMNGDPFRMFVFGGWKLDSDPPVASAGLRCLTFRVPPSDASMSEEAALAQRALMMQSRNNAIAAGTSETHIKRIKLSQRPVKCRPSPTSLRADEVGHAALAKLRGHIATSLQAESKHDDSTLSWRVICDLWLHQCIALDPPNTERTPFFLSAQQTLDLARQTEALFKQEETVLSIEGPTKIFGDIHGQFDDLIRLFKAFGSPDHHIGDIEENSYVFLGDIVDRGRYSLEVLCLLLAFKLQYPQRVFLVRGNHEDSAMNKSYGFGAECMARFGSESVGATVWTAFDNLFNWLPLAAVVNKRILCVHGGIGRVSTLDQIRAIPRPLRVEHDPSKGDPVLMDVLWSDPAESDVERGVQPNTARHVSVVFGADRVLEFCAQNDIDVIVRAHQCVMEGYEYFARGHLITIFSATNYCGVQQNKGAILHVTDRQDHWLITPKFIEPHTDTPTPQQTWVNLPQMPPSPMRHSAPAQPAPVPTLNLQPTLAAGAFDAVENAFPSLSFNTKSGSSSSGTSMFSGALGTGNTRYGASGSRNF